MKSIFENISKYNVWDGKLYFVSYEQNEYLSTIKNYIGNNLVKVLVGLQSIGGCLK